MNRSREAKLPPGSFLLPDFFLTDAGRLGARVHVLMPFTLSLVTGSERQTSADVFD